jgi:sorting and assembly machinery component 37
MYNRELNVTVPSGGEVFKKRLIDCCRSLWKLMILRHPTTIYTLGLVLIADELDFQVADQHDSCEYISRMRSNGVFTFVQTPNNTMLQLYILGPAFGLPSIDAECNAAVALLKSHFGSDQDGWEIIPTHEHETTLPYLRSNDTTVHGYAAIAQHISDVVSTKGDNLTAAKAADSTALSSFLNTHAPTLLSISLYVSSENYRHATRPAFTALLPWHANYILPPRRRAAARAMTDHLNISSIDVDSVHEDNSSSLGGVGKDPSQQGFEAQAKERASLLLPRKDTIRSMLQRPEHAAIFRLHAVAEEFFAPLRDMLGEKEFFMDTEEPTEVDCLAYGFLALMLLPEVPQAWLAKTMKEKHSNLVRFIERMHTKLDLETKVQDVMDLANCTSEENVQGRRKARSLSLPWCPPARPTILETVSRISKELVEQVPYFKSPPTVVHLRSTQQPLWKRHMPAIVLGTFASIALGSYYAIQTGILVWPHGESIQIFGRRRFTDYGHLGAALSGIGLLGQQVTRGHQQAELDVSPLEVDVTVRGDDGV